MSTMVQSRGEWPTISPPRTTGIRRNCSLQHRCLTRHNDEASSHRWDLIPWPLARCGPAPSPATPCHPLPQGASGRRSSGDDRRYPASRCHLMSPHTQSPVQSSMRRYATAIRRRDDPAVRQQLWTWRGDMRRSAHARAAPWRVTRWSATNRSALPARHRCYVVRRLPRPALVAEVVLLSPSTVWR